MAEKIVITKSLSEYEADVKALIQKYNEANLNNNSDERDAAEIGMGKAEKCYAVLKETSLYNGLMSAANPMLAAIVAYSYDVIGHRDDIDAETNAVTRKFTTKTKQIDLMLFEDFAKSHSKKAIAPDTNWRFKVEKLNQLLCMKAAEKLGTTIDEASYYMADVSRKISFGKTPLSNTNTLKTLQSVVNAIVFEDDGNGLNKFKVTSHDVNYLFMTYVKKGKVALSVLPTRHDQLRKLLGDMLYRIAENKSYTVEYKKVKPADTGKNENKTVEEKAA